MKSIKILCFLLAVTVLSCTSCAVSNYEKVDNSGMYDDNEMVENSGDDVVVSSEFDSSAKVIKYKKLPYFGYKDGLDYLETFNFNGFGESFDDFEVDKDGRVISGNWHIDSEYIMDDGDAGLCLDYNAIAKDYLENYNKATKRSGDFIITDFEDGVCINEYIYDKTKVNNNSLTVGIPETIDGKKVLKLGAACKKVWDNDISMDYEYIETGFLINVPSKINVTVKIPKTVRDICYSSLDNSFDDFFDDEGYYSDNPEVNKNAKRYEKTFISRFVVDKDNPYYSSIKGSLYTKNMKWLLYICAGLNETTIPDSVRYISNEALDYYSGEDDLVITIGENVNNIHGIRYSCDEEDKLIYRVKKGSFADKYLHSKDNSDVVDEKHIEYYE